MDIDTQNAGSTTPPEDSIKAAGEDPNSTTTPPESPVAPPPATPPRITIARLPRLVDAAGKPVKYKRPKTADKMSWSERAVKAKLDFAEFFTVPTLSKFQLSGCMESLELLKNVIGFGSDIASGKKRDTEGNLVDATISEQDRINAVTSVAEATKIYVEKSIEIVKLSEFAHGKANGDNGNKPKNKPPSLGFESTAPDGTVTRVVATSGESPA